MKVTMLAKEYPPYVYGGAGVHLKNLAKELAKIMSVEVKCFGDQDISLDGLRVKGFKPWEILKSSCNPKHDPLYKTLTTNLAMLASGIDSDVVHTHTWYAHLAGYISKMLYKKPFVATSHSLEPLRPWKQDQLAEAYFVSTWMEKIGIENADRVVAVSGLMKEDIIKYFNVDPEKVVIIHNGIDLEKWHSTEITDDLKNRYGIKDDYILFVGRPTPQKGMEYLVDASDSIDVQIVLGAVGADTKDYENKMIQKVKAKKNIVWIHELLKEEEYIQLYTSARVFVCPSIYEPFGIINLEAMACGTPVVASAVGGIKEVVLPEETGLLIEPSNPDAIAKAVNRILGDKKLAEKFSINGRLRVEEHFGWDLIARKTKKMYEEMSRV